jgi:hypothetical protein
MIITPTVPSIRDCSVYVNGEGPPVTYPLFPFMFTGAVKIAGNMTLDTATVDRDGNRIYLEMTTPGGNWQSIGITVSTAYNPLVSGFNNNDMKQVVVNYYPASGEEITTNSWTGSCPVAVGNRNSGPWDDNVNKLTQSVHTDGTAMYYQETMQDWYADWLNGVDITCRQCPSTGAPVGKRFKWYIEFIYVLGKNDFAAQEWGTKPGVVP